jgi:hypothetical protein
VTRSTHFFARRYRLVTASRENAQATAPYQNAAIATATTTTASAGNRSQTDPNSALGAAVAVGFGLAS